MRSLYIDCSSGLSGDMALGAFLDLGVPEEVLQKGLSCLGINEFRLEITKKEINGILATDVDVVLFDKKSARIHPYSGTFRNYGDVKRIIMESDLSDNVKNISRRIFEIKARAEAQVHGVSVDNVQFHEAGAVDSIVDIVGTAICFDHLQVDSVISYSVPTGFGTIQCACGELPVPAPAVRAILEREKIPNYRSEVEQELLTPTGAAILAGLTDRFENRQQLPDKVKTGYGTGKRQTGLPPLKLLLTA